jgi:hypothetical protein
LSDKFVEKAVHVAVFFFAITLRLYTLEFLPLYCVKRFLFVVSGSSTQMAFHVRAELHSLLAQTAYYGDLSGRSQASVASQDSGESGQSLMRAESIFGEKLT